MHLAMYLLSIKNFHPWLHIFEIYEIDKKKQTAVVLIEYKANISLAFNMCGYGLKEVMLILFL